MSEPIPTVARAPVILTHRLFFAVWPLPAVRQALADRVDRLPAGLGRLQRPDQWHVTLEFLGAVPPDRLAAVLEAGAVAAASGRPCEVLFDAIEYWRRPQVVCLTARETTGARSGLVQSLRDQLQGRGFEPERREFRAHLNFMFSQVLSMEKTRTLPIAIYNFVSYAEVDWGGVMSAAVAMERIPNGLGTPTGEALCRPNLCQRRYHMAGRGFAIISLPSRGGAQ